MAKKTTTKTTTKKPKIPPLSQLCWNCKRAVNSKDFKCPWADTGIPVEGWCAIQNTVHQSGRKDIDSYYVTSCPLYVQDKPWGCDHRSALVWLAKELKFTEVYVRCNWLKMLEFYEQTRGEKLPLWMYEKNYRTDTKNGNKRINTKAKHPISR